jgi:hypothetical protein
MKTISQSIMDKAVSETQVLHFLNKEVSPVLRRVREIINHQYDYQTFGDESVTLTADSPWASNWASPLTADRDVTISTENARNLRLRVTRATASTGAFDLNVSTLIALDPGQWCDVHFDGTNLVLTGAGWLTV